MTFTTGNTLARESGASCSHLTLAITIGGNTRTLRFTLDELQGEPPASVEQAKEWILARLRSAAKEAGAATFAQVRSALESKTFQI